MRYTKLHWLAVLLVMPLFLSACNLGQEPEPTLDTGAIFTAAAETVLAQYAVEQTQTALAMPTATQPSTATVIPTLSANGSGAPTLPTNAAVVVTTPLPTFGIGTQSSTTTLATNTPLSALAAQPTQSCLNSAFIADVTYPDDTVVKQDTDLRKVWSIQNTGTCPWEDGFSLQPVLGNAKGEWVIDVKKKFVNPNEIVQMRIDIRTPSKKGDWGGCWKMKDDNDNYFGTFLCLRVKVE